MRKTGPDRTLLDWLARTDSDMGMRRLILAFFSAALVTYVVMIGTDGDIGSQGARGSAAADQNEEIPIVIDPPQLLE